MKAKIIILAVFSVFILNVNNVHATVISDSGTYQIGTLGNYGTNDFFTQLIDNHRDLTGGNGTFLLTNPTPVDIPINQTLLNHYFGYNNTPITSTSILILSNVIHSDNITDYTNVCQQYNLTNKTNVQSPRNNTILKNGGFLNPTNAYDKNHNTWAVANRSATAALANSTLFRNFTLDIPANAVIDGIQIISELNISATTGTFYYEVNNGTRYSKMNYSQAGSTTRTNYTKGSPTDLWGLIWNSTTANNISVNITAFGSSTNRIQKLEEIWVNITYHTIETNQSNCSDVPIGWHWNNYTTQDFIPVPNTTLKSGDTAIISVIANWPAKLGDIAIDWIPLLIIPKSITGADNDTILTKENWAWWNTSFTSCRNITITNNNGYNLVNFPLWLNFSFTSNQSTYSDLRFVDTYCSNGGNLLFHWQENYTTGNFKYDLEFVNVTSIPTTGTVISVYYNSISNSDSNGNMTFNWFDDFSTDRTASYKTTAYSFVPTLAVGGGYLNVTGNDNEQQIWLKTTNFTNSIVGIKGRILSASGNRQLGVISRWTPGGQSYDVAELESAQYSVYGQGSTRVNSPQTYDVLPWRIFHLQTNVSANGGIVVLNGTFINSSTMIQLGTTETTTDGTTKMPCGVYVYGSSQYYQFDDFFIGNNTYPYPTYSTGSELNYTVPDTTPPTYSTITINNTNPAILDQVNFSFNASDNIQLDKAIFGWNASGAGCNAWANDTGVSFMAGNWSNVTKQIPATCLLANVGGISFQFYFNDTSNIWNTTPVYNISGFNTAPANSCTYGGSGDWNIVDNCSITANTDIGTNTLRLLCTGQTNILAQIIFGHLEKSNNCIVVKDNTKALIKVG